MIRRRYPAMMSIPRLRFAALVLILFFVRPATAQSGPPTDLDSYVARDMKTFDVPGIAIAIVKDGKVVLAKGYGVRKLGEAAAVDENTLFGIGSNTKALLPRRWPRWWMREKFRGTTKCTSG
jgi:CubicO group peptidase (beta-lactamase class C family)